MFCVAIGQLRLCRLRFISYSNSLRPSTVKGGQQTAVKECSTCRTDVRPCQTIMMCSFQAQNFVWAGWALLSTPPSAKSGAFFNFHALLPWEVLRCNTEAEHVHETTLCLIGRPLSDYSAMQRVLYDRRRKWAIRPGSQELHAHLLKFGNSAVYKQLRVHQTARGGGSNSYFSKSAKLP